MDFFGMGMGEILLVIIVALIIWGPGKLPEIARQMGKAVNTLKKTSSDLTAQIKKELDEEEAASRKHSPLSEAHNSPKPTTTLPVVKPEAGSAGKTDTENP